MLKGTPHRYVIFFLNKDCVTFSDISETMRDLLPRVFPPMAPVHHTNASISDWFIPLFTASFAITLVIYKLGSLLSSANTRKNTIKSSKTWSIILIKDFYQFVFRLYM